jgi:hypothetical protein
VSLLSDNGLPIDEIARLVSHSSTAVTELVYRHSCYCEYGHSAHDCRGRAEADRTQASPFGAHGAEDWSMPALGLIGIATAFLEPDPAVEWDGERIARVTGALAG